jgi:hypothetical protein
MSNLSDFLGSGISTVSDLSNVTVSASDPAVDTNPTAVGGLWLNKTSGEMYTCTDATAGANIWTNVGDGTDPVKNFTRGVFAGGYDGGGGNNTIQYVRIITLGNATDFGDLTTSRWTVGASSDGERGVFMGGGENLTDIDYITIRTTGNATDFGDLTIGLTATAGMSDGTKGVCGGGMSYGDIKQDVMNYITISTTGNATDFGNLSLARRYLSACSNSSRGLFAGGNYTGTSATTTIDYITYSSLGDATDFGDLTQDRHYLSGCASSTRGVFGGYIANDGTIIDYVTIASTSNASDFGDLSQGRGQMGACASDTRGLFGGGYTSSQSSPASSTVDIIDYITIATTGNATDFGNLTSALRFVSACSGA